jgi:hypothetical protein
LGAEVGQVLEGVAFVPAVVGGEDVLEVAEDRLGDGPVDLPGL